MIKARIGRMNYVYDWSGSDYVMVDGWGWYGLIEHFFIEHFLR